MRTCKRCGRQLNDDAKFCGFCGKKCVDKNKSLPLGLAGTVLLVLIISALCIWGIKGRDRTPAGRETEDTERTGQLSQTTSVALPFNESDENIQAERKLIQINEYVGGVLRTKSLIRYNPEGLICEKENFIFSDDGSFNCEVKSVFTYDGNRIIKKERYYSDYIGLEDSTDYVYDLRGNLIQSNYAGISGWKDCTYKYDAQNKLIQSVMEYEVGTQTIDYVYSADGTLLQEKITDCANGETQTELIEGDDLPVDCYDYKPFVIKDGLAVCLCDGAGNTISAITLYSPEYASYASDEEGYLMEVCDQLSQKEKRLFQFLYDDDRAENGIYKTGKLSYPISEEDCYIIYKNYFGYEMGNDDTIDIVTERLGVGADEQLVFSIYRLNPNHGGYTLQGTFDVYVNSGICVRDDIMFHADNYYN